MRLSAVRFREAAPSLTSNNRARAQDPGGPQLAPRVGLPPYRRRPAVPLRPPPYRRDRRRTAAVPPRPHLPDLARPRPRSTGGSTLRKRSGKCVGRRRAGRAGRAGPGSLSRLRGPGEGQTTGVTEEISGAPAGGPPSNEVRLALGDDLQAPGRARAAVRRALVDWKLPALVEDAVLAVSELVTNALVHGRPPVELTLHCSGGQVRIGVHDNNPAQPPMTGSGHSPTGATSGRGVAIITALADDVGCEQVPEDGKIVYASFLTSR